MILILVISVLAGGSGCAMVKVTPTEEKIVSGMEEKYGEEFRFVEWRTLRFGSKSCTAHLECDSLPGKLIKAGQEISGDGDMIYFDNYMGYRYEDEIREELESAVKCVYPESRVLFLVPSCQFPLYMGPEMSAEDIMHDPDTLLAAMIIAKQPWDEQEKEIQMEQLRRELEERQIRVDGNLFITQDETAFEQIDSMNYSEWTAREDWFSGRCYFAMDQAYEFYYANWR